MTRRMFMQVSLLAIGIVIGGLLQPFQFVPSFAQGDCRSFPETGKQVCGRFLEYWAQNGGLAQQGLPLSGEFTEVNDLDGKQYVVQYFERAVFEKHPENAPPYDVLLSQLGTFQFKRKYPNGEPGGTSPPPAQPTPVPPSSGPKLEVMDYQIVTASSGGGSAYGYVKNTGTVDLGGIEIVGSFKDAAGKLVGTGTDSGAVLKPNDLWPFELTESADFTSVDIQLVYRPATESDRRSSYRDYQVTDTNVVPPSDFSYAKIVGNVKNIGTLTGSLIQVNVLVTDNAGKTLDVDYSYTAIDDLAPGASSPFEVRLNVDEVPNFQVFVESWSE